MQEFATEKKQLRQKARALRQQLSLAEQKEKSREVTQQILKLPEFISSHSLAAYWPMDSEISPIELLQEAQDRGIECYLPLMLNPTLHSQSLEFIRYQTGDPLIKNNSGILEPCLIKKSGTENTKIEASKLDLILIPLLAFNTHGHRLGSGGGYYDKAFAFLNSKIRPQKPFLLGLAYELQCLETIPVNDWDIQLNGIMTEKRLIRI